MDKLEKLVLSFPVELVMFRVVVEISARVQSRKAHAF